MTAKKHIPEYTKSAIEKYNSKLERFTLSLPIGSKEEIKERTGLSLNKYFNELYKRDLEESKK